MKKKEDLIYGQNLYKHGLYGTKLYHVWEKIKARTENPKHINFNNYGGRGILLCNEWKDFLPFYEWAIKNGHQDDLFIDRIDNDGNYEPNNCRWVDRIENANNRRNNRWYNYQGQTKTISQWSRELDIKYWTLYKRLTKSNMTIKEAFTSEVR